MRISESIFRVCRNIKKQKDKGPVLKNSSIPAVDFTECLIYIAIRKIKMKMTGSLSCRSSQSGKEAYMLTGHHNTMWLCYKAKNAFNKILKEGKAKLAR